MRGAATERHATSIACDGQSEGCFASAHVMPAALAAGAGPYPIPRREAPQAEPFWEGVRRRAGGLYPDRSSRDMRQNALHVFLIRVASAGLLFASQVLLARWMGAADYGIYVSLWTAVLVAGGLSHLGLNLTMMRLVPQYLAGGKLSELRGLLRGGRGFAFAMGTAVAALGTCFVWLASDRLAPGTAAPVLIALACLPMYALTDVQDGIGRGQRWTLAGLAPPYLLRPFLILAFVAVAHLASLPPSATLAMAAALVATWSAGLVQAVLVERRLRTVVSKGPLSTNFRAWLGISLPLLAVGGCELVLQNTDVLMLNLFCPPAEIGAYYAATKTTTLSLFVHYAVGSAYAGRIAAAGALGDREALRSLVREAVMWTFWPSLAIVGCVVALGEPLLSLFGPGFQEAYPIILVLAVGMLARAATGPSETVLNMLGEQRACARAFGIAALICIVLNAALIPLFGAIGAAIATTAAFSTAAALNWMNARLLLKLDVFVFAKAGGLR